jgi:glycosyltransferase involved in cell wall biosynthesis
MKSAPEVSVITATYNDGPYLSQAIESILNQTFSDFEYIIIDDASADDTAKILHGYAAQDARIVVHRNNENMGRAISRNCALELAHGKWVAVFDGDDISHPERFERQLAYLNARPEVDYMGTGCHYINKQTGESISDRVFIPPLTHGQIRWKLCYDFPFHHSSTIGRRKLFISAGRYPEVYPVCEDISLWMGMVNQNAHFANIPDKLLTYRVNTMPKYYALNQVIAQQLHRKHIINASGINVSEAVFNIIWQTNTKGMCGPSIEADTVHIVEAIRIMATLYRTLESQDVFVDEDRSFIQSDLLDRILKVMLLIDSNIDLEYHQSAYQYTYQLPTIPSQTKNGCEISVA